MLFSGILNFIFRCQHCALTLATTSPTRQLRRQRRRVSGRLTKQKALTVNCGRSVKVYYVFNVLQEHRLHQRDCWCRLRGCPWTLGKPPSGWFFMIFSELCFQFPSLTGLGSPEEQTVVPGSLASPPPPLRPPSLPH